MKFILGKKIEMTQIWKDDSVMAVTKVQAGPCVVTQVKNKDKDGYEAVQLGFGEKKEKNIAKPQRGHLAKVQSAFKDKIGAKYLKEFRLKESVELSIGDIIDASAFEPGDTVKVTGTSKGRGFQGVVKRHGFGGQNKSHGTKDQLRMPGSIGATGPARVFKGVRMPGRMGGDRVTVKNLEIIDIDKDNNILYIKGAVPGARNGLILISGEGELKVAKKSAAAAVDAEEKASAKDEVADKKSEKKDNKEETVKDKKVEDKKTEDKKAENEN